VSLRNRNGGDNVRLESYKPEDTFQIARELGEQAKAGDVLCLIGDLGVGKTLFSQGFAAGLGVKERVSSPTFTIVQQYDEGRLPFYHFDVYRIEDSEEMYEVGFTDMLYGNGVCLIEWADLIKDIWPESYKKVTIEKNLDKGFDYRLITIEENQCKLTK
jgi:tRNA threonylcarbamoyladenosine biosynthesis protein TsaE